MKTKNVLYECISYAILITLVILGLFIIYHHADLNYPLAYSGGDEMGVFYLAKTIQNYGVSLENPDVGGTIGADLYDYVYCDKLSFLMVKVISFFVTNPYMIVNIFYMLCYILVAISAYYVCRMLMYNYGISALVAVLYAFSPFIQQRYAHLWLVPYFMLPLVCLTAIWIVKGEMFDEKSGKINKRRFIQSLFISFFSAFTGFYYAFFACVIFAMALIIRIINSGKKINIKEFYPVANIFTILIGVIVNVLPNIIYIIHHGPNAAGELAIRNPGDAEFYALKLIQMVLPRANHRIGLFARLVEKYNSSYPLVNENYTAALGIIATVGLVIALIKLLKDQEKDKTYSYFVIGLFLVGTIGGLGSCFSLVVYTPMRSYNRISLLIMFFCLLTVASILKKYSKKVNMGAQCIIIACLMLIGFLDQTITYSGQQTASIDSTREFVSKIEQRVNRDAYIFEMPYVDWPSGGSYRMFAGYLESDSLRWSYGCMQGREEAKWQQEVLQLETEDMVSEIKQAGYEGIYLDTVVYASQTDEDGLWRRISELNDVMQQAPLVSENGELYFWDFSAYP